MVSEQLSMDLTVPPRRDTSSTAWFTQKQIASLLGLAVTTINEAITRIKTERGASIDSHVRKFRIPVHDGKIYEVEHYDMAVLAILTFRAQATPAAIAVQDTIIEALSSVSVNLPATNAPARVRRPPCAGYVYLVRSVSGHYKIGRARNVRDRMKTFDIKLPFEVALDHVIRCADYKTAELALHQRYADRRVDGEWFALTEGDIAAIKQIESM